MTLGSIANRRRDIRRAFEDHYWPDNPPEWAKDPFNDGASCTCGYCGAWMTVVRPGKVQCDACDWLAQ